MRKSSMIRIGMVIFCLLLSTALLSCGHNDSDPPSTSKAVSSATFHDPPLTLVGSSEGGGLFSWLTELITEGLREGATIFVADKTSGWVLNFISDKLFGNETDEMLKEMNERLVEIQGQLHEIEAKLVQLQKQLLITKVELKTYINNIKISAAIARIQSAYDSGDDASLMGLSNSAQSVNKADSTAVEKLKANVGQYATNYRYTIHEDIQSLHDAICPPTSDVSGILKDFADQIILTKVDPGKLADPANAMDAYKLLETFFSQVLNYQTKALIIVSEINNYYDSTGGQTTAYFNNKYKQLLKDEIARFQWTVNYLMVNMIDYRTKENFRADSAYLNEGLARDDLFLQVFARSRFFTAQLLEGIGEPTYTLHGAIIIPRDYTPQDDAVQNITLQLDGPNNTSIKKTVNVSDAALITGRFPYTKWSASGKSAPDNNWLFYDFNFNDMTNDIPAGTYKITLVDNGDQNSPWFHTSTDLGQVSIKYYDPKKFDPDTATLTPTTTNTVKFGAFSGRWNWGYCRLASSGMPLWTVPEKTATRGKDNPELLGKTQYFPHKSAKGPINTLGLSFDSVLYKGNKFTEYTINLPFKVGGAPDDTTKASANIFYLQNGYVMLENPDGADAYIRYNLLDLTSKTDTTISSQHTSNWRNVAPYTNAFVSVNEWFPDKYGTAAKLTFNPSHSYELSVDAELAYMAGAYWSSQAYGSGSLSAYWKMQVVYTNTYNIF